MPITAEQFLWDQLSKSTVDTIYDILKHVQIQQNMTLTHNEQVSKDTTENNASDIQQNSMQDNISRNSYPN